MQNSLQIDGLNQILFPRNLYISPGKISINNNKTYDTVFVENETEMKAAVKEGYIDSGTKNN